MFKPSQNILLSLTRVSIDTENAKSSLTVTSAMYNISVAIKLYTSPTVLHLRAFEVKSH